MVIVKEVCRICRSIHVTIRRTKSRDLYPTGRNIGEMLKPLIIKEQQSATISVSVVLTGRSVWLFTIIVVAFFHSLTSDSASFSKPVHRQHSRKGVVPDN